MNAKLVLENGIILPAKSFGADGEVTGELVFNTSMTGYQEILTDPSYCGQIVTMTYPLIGNYGVNREDMEGIRSHVSGFVVRECSRAPSSFRSTESLETWLRSQNIMAVEGVDTRMLTRIIRDVGAMRSLITTSDASDDVLLEKVRNSPRMTGLDLTREVSCLKPYEWRTVDGTPFALRSDLEPSMDGRSYNVVVYDFGVKRNILRRLASYGCAITVVPSDFPAEEVLALRPDGIVLSNGPGDPEAVGYAIKNIKSLIELKPTFGICLGHQLLALALGGKTYKLKFGHRGANHPVKNLLTGEIEITAQNHGFGVDIDSLKSSEIEATHTNLNDGTNEGFRHRELPVFCVQYHPEASPGPHDSDYLFRHFISLMKEHQAVAA